MNNQLKQLREQLKQGIKDRNEKIAQEAILGKKSLSDLAKHHHITRERITQILHTFGVKVPMRKGQEKYETWRRRISIAKTKKK